MFQILKTFLFVAAFGLLSMAVYGQGDKKSDDPVVSFTGTWETIAGNSSRYTVQMKQTGNKVVGSYSPRNGKIFGGIVVGNKLTFKWTQDEGYEGTAEFVMDDEGKGFAGSSTAIKPVEMTNTWKTYVPAPPSSFAGTWNLVNNIGVRVPLVIAQEGAKVTGIYPSQNGSIEGTVDGRILQFKWVSDKGSGTGQFRISSSGETFGGTFPGFTDFAWWGERSTEVMGFGGKKMGSYGGTWSVDESGPKGSMELKQSGKAVTGVYRTAKGIYDLDEASVNGTILRFILVPRKPTNSPRVGEVIVDGKSFKGTIDGIAVTGILKAP
ncbi:MAG: hypothetical protein QM785_08515 [Pyrinomonadaceae bacterium]